MVVSWVAVLSSEDMTARAKPGSFVGPRPERPEFIAKAVEDIPEFVLRHGLADHLAANPHRPATKTWSYTPAPWHFVGFRCCICRQAAGNILAWAGR